MRLVVNVAAARDLLERNKTRHVAEYELQLEAWKKAYVDYTEELKRWSQEQHGESTKSPREPVQPQYYVHEYDELIRKLNVHVGDNVEIGDGYNDEYEKIFENKFNWSRGFGALTGQYTTSGYINAADKARVDSL